MCYSYRKAQTPAYSSSVCSGSRHRSAALLPTGEIIYCGGDQHDREQWRLHHDQGIPLDATRIFDCVTIAIRNPGSPTGDVFCCGHAMLGDGRVLLAGGTEIFVEEDPGLHHSHMPGLNSVCAYDPFSRTWNNAIAPLNDPYPRFLNRATSGNSRGRTFVPEPVDIRRRVDLRPIRSSQRARLTAQQSHT